MAAGEHHLRIGELSRRVGVSPELLRAWERRYGLLRPERTAGGFRLYSSEDEQRIRLMLEQLSRGLSAAEAARVAAAGAVSPPREASPGLEEDATALRAALDSLDEEAAQTVLDRLLATFMLETVLESVILPYLRELGERWENGEVTVGQEHFASNLLRGWLLAGARGWGQGRGPIALLACAPGELHDLPLIVFGLGLRRRGWRIAFLGADTPIATVQETAERLQPSLVVVSAMLTGVLERTADDLEALARSQALALAGSASDELVQRLGATRLVDDPLAAAAAVAASR